MTASFVIGPLSPNHDKPALYPVASTRSTATCKPRPPKIFAVVSGQCLNYLKAEKDQTCPSCTELKPPGLTAAAGDKILAAINCMKVSAFAPRALAALVVPPEPQAGLGISRRS